MLEFLQTGRMLYVLAAICALGTFSTLVTGSLYKRLIKETGNMALTKDKNLKALKQRMENVFLINHGIRNVNAYIEKQLYGFRFMHMSLDGWDNLSVQAMILCFMAGGAAAFGAYWYRCDNYYIVLYGAAGVFGGLFLAFVDNGIGAGTKRKQLADHLVDYVENSPHFYKSVDNSAYAGQERKKNTRRYLICGILAVGIGILLDPMSVLGLFSKLSGTGTSPAQAIKESAAGFVASVFGNVLWMAGFCILFVINLVRSVRKAEKKDNRLVWLEWLLAGYCALIVLTTRFPYFKVAYPLMFVVIVMEMTSYAMTITNHYRSRIVYSVLALVFIGSSLVYTYQEKHTEVQANDQIEAALEDADTDRLILIRDHAEGYECFPLLKRYESVYVLTMGEEKLDALLTDTQIGTQKNITVLITNTKTDDEIFRDWVLAHKLGDDMDTLCKTGKYEVVKWHIE